MNLRSYYPDFVAVDENKARWILETKGAEDWKCRYKDRAAVQWCENATQLSGTRWQYLESGREGF